MAQTGYTPILIYSSSTGGNAPAAGNLTNSTLGSELAINIADGKLFYKDSGGSVQVIGWKTVPTSAGGTGLTSYTAGDVLYYASGTALSKLAIGSSGAYMSSSGSAPQWTAPAALTKTDDTNVTLTLGGSASTALLNAASITVGWTGTLAVSRGGTGTGTAFTAGSVLFAGASGIYSQDNANLFWDDTNNYFGIGTATPVGILELQSATPKQTISNNSNTSTSTGTVYSTLAMRSLKGGGAGSFAYDDAWIQTQRSNYNYNGDFFTHDTKLVFFTNDSNRDNDPTARMSLDAQGLTLLNNGNLIIGTSGNGLTSTGTMTVKSSSGGGNWNVYSSASSTNPVYFVNGSGTVNGVATGANGTAAMLYVNKDSGNLRSINAAGTLNASGADYAEYELKNDACGVISKGQIVGFDADGKLTDKWAQAKSFAVKTTNPSYVGGDTWGNDDVVGVAPECPQYPQATGENESPTQEQIDQYQTAFDQYQIDLAAWKEKLEVERQKVDRIAYAGKVPCNVNGAKVGDYIIAVQSGEAIDGVAVEAPTFDQYRFAVGKVRAILPDGRCEIAVIIH